MLPPARILELFFFPPPKKERERERVNLTWDFVTDLKLTSLIFGFVFFFKRCDLIGVSLYVFWNWMEIL